MIYGYSLVALNNAPGSWQRKQDLTMSLPEKSTYSMFLSKSFYEFNIFLTSVNLAL